MGCERDYVTVLVFHDLSTTLRSFESTDDATPDTDSHARNLIAQQNHCGNPKFVNYISLAVSFKRANVSNGDFLHQKTVDGLLQKSEPFLF